MKVLMFGWEFPPNISGGLGTACHGLVNGLSSIGDVDITFVVPKVFGNEESTHVSLISAGDIALPKSRNGQVRSKDTLEYIEVHSRLVPYVDPDSYSNQTCFTVEGTNSVVRTNNEGKINFSGKYGPDLFTEIAGYSLIAGIIAKNNRFDVIHAHDWLTFPAGIKAKKVTGKPLVVHVHATDFDRSGGNVDQGVYEIEKQGMMEADSVITVSNLTRNTVIEKYGIPSGKVHTVYNAVEPFQRTDNGYSGKGFSEKLVTFLGRITTQKGPEYFVDTAGRILKKVSNVRFVMAGSGDMMSRMISRVAKLKISDKFHFAGFLKGDDVFRMYRMSDVFVMPSVSEPFGISPLEAMQLGVPVIISRQSGVSEILTNAIKIDFWDIEAMSNAICGILAYPSISKMLSENGREETGHIRWEESARKVRKIYKELTGK
jgi:glycosyltransferase involved in cell wall biosynthesis